MYSYNYVVVKIFFVEGYCILNISGTNNVSKNPSMILKL